MSSGVSDADIVNGSRITQIEHESVQSFALSGVGTFFMRAFRNPKRLEDGLEDAGVEVARGGPCSAPSYLAEEGRSSAWIPSRGYVLLGLQVSCTEFGCSVDVKARGATISRTDEHGLKDSLGCRQLDLVGRGIERRDTLGSVF
jgi:hypothetical protein